MSHAFRIAVILVTAAGAAVSGCSDASDPTGAPIEQPFFREAPAPGFTVVTRTAPLREGLSVTRTVGSEGGTVELPEAGITLVFPRGALGSPTPITIDAYAGHDVAFELEPHGTRFNLPVSVLLDTRGTTADRLGDSGGDLIPVMDFVGVYFEGDPRQGAVTPLETFPMDLQHERLHFTIRHFSGYASASN